MEPAAIQRVVRSSYSEFRTCYERGLGRNPELRGSVTVRFVIEPDGSVKEATLDVATIPDEKVVECVRSTYLKMTFPVPDGGAVTVVYPVLLEPG